MILRAPKVQTKFFCNFSFDIKFLGLFYASDKALNLLYTGGRMY